MVDIKVLQFCQEDFIRSMGRMFWLVPTEIKYQIVSALPEMKKVSLLICL